MRKEFQNKRELWLAKNAFNTDGITYVYFPKDAYEVKETLKQDGFYFNPNLMWHNSCIPAGYEDKVFPISASEIISFSDFGNCFFNKDTREIIINKINSLQPQSELSVSNWIGQEKERIYDIPCTLVSLRIIETKFGPTQLVKFITAEGNELTWFTTVNINAEPGEEIFLTGTVKSHSEYKGTKSTILNRCKIKRKEV